jgi:hypothetical protein
MAKGLGRRLAKDDRDKQYLMRRLLPPVGTVLPVSKTWGINSTALDQGETGTCVGHGWANFLRCAPIRSNAGIDSLRWQIYDAAILLDEWPDNDHDTERQMGTSVRAGAKAVSNMGRLKSYVWEFDLQPAIEWVLTMGPVVLGTNWYSSMFEPDKDGIVQISPKAYVKAGHCYLWRAANTRKAMALCSNSWSDDWGKSGEFYIPFRDLERLIHEDGECAAAIEQSLRAKQI